MTRYLIRNLVLASIISFIGLKQPVWAADANCGPFNVAMYELGSLFYFDEAKGYLGIDKDIIEAVASRTGCEFKPFLDSRVRIWTYLADGTLDMSVSGIPNPEREQFARFIIYFQARNYLLVRPELAKRLNSLDAFFLDPKLRLAVVKSFKHGKNFDQWIDDLRAQGRVDEYPDIDAVARIFRLGRVDGLLSMPVVWSSVIKRNQLEGKVSFLDFAPDDRIPHGLILSRKRIPKEAAERMRQAVSAMQEDGTLEKIFNRYLPADIVKRMMPSQ
ncbi:hypothetical protein CSQ89_17360 [Chitinimonas sp. BJB300]|nr:hypothetical protein CSQ89_17360 [Chitinimonas sp. BJB300]TSJ89961.1 amino acid ABC transporter substrate-binding protein [Chitinimonas sp. BJB300]